MGNVTIDISGCINSNTPRRKVKVPKINVHPQLSILLRLAIEKIISVKPEKRKETLKIIASAKYDSKGDVKV